MTNPLRYFPEPAPKSLAQLTRPQLAARIAALRRALDLVAEQADLDGAEPFACVGRMKIALLDLEKDLRARDKAAEQGEPLPVEVALAMVGRKSWTSGPEGTERHDQFTGFIRRLAEWQAYALAGDPEARQVMGEYGLCRWCGHRPQDALAVAETDARAAGGSDA